MMKKISGLPVYTLNFDMVDLQDCNGVFTTFQKAVDALMYHYDRMKDGLDWRWTKPELEAEADWNDDETQEKGWAVYVFDLIDLNRDKIYHIGASIERIYIDAV